MKSSPLRTFQFSTMLVAVFDIYCCVERGVLSVGLSLFFEGWIYFYRNIRILNNYPYIWINKHGNDEHYN